MFTPLHIAVLNNNRRIVDHLIAIGDVQVNAIDKEHRRAPLHWAVVENNTVVVERLLSRPGINTCQPDIYNLTPVDLARFLGYDVIVSLLSLPDL